MALAHSPPKPTQSRRSIRRKQTIDEALDHAVAIMSEHGVGGLSISEVARRMGMRAPSLYKYFDSLHALYDALFAYGIAAQSEAILAATGAGSPGVERLRAMVRASVRWCVENPALAQLLYWRVVPGFEPSTEAFASSAEQMSRVATELSEAMRNGRRARRSNAEHALRLLTVIVSGLVTQQMANEPGVRFERGVFSSLTDELLDMFLDRYA
jgi:AcrR family transcriptional regulator